MKSNPEIDAIDMKIIKALLKDARANFTDIAKDSNISATAITKRYQKMKKNGILTGTSFIIVSKARNEYSLSIDIKAEGGYETTIIEAIKKIPRVLNCFRVIGRYDIHAAIRVESLKEITRIKQTVQKQKGVLSLEITSGLTKASFFPENLLIKSIEEANNGQRRPENY